MGGGGGDGGGGGGGSKFVFDCLNFGVLLTSNSQGKTLQSGERKLNNCLAETFIPEYFSMNFDTWQRSEEEGEK